MSSKCNNKLILVFWYFIGGDEKLKLGSYTHDGDTFNVTRGDYSPLMDRIAQNLAKAKVRKIDIIFRNVIGSSQTDFSQNKM